MSADAITKAIAIMERDREALRAGHGHPAHGGAIPAEDADATAADAEYGDAIAALRAALPGLREAGEPVARFCPACGSVGPVPEQYRDCCPDGNKARMIPESLAHNCRDLFQLALLAPSDPDEIPAPPSPAPQPEPEFDVRRILLAVVPGDGNGEEVYARSIDDVVDRLTKQAERIEELESKAAQPAQGGGVVEALRKAVEALETVEVHDGEVHRVVHLVHYATEGGKAALAALAAQTDGGAHG